MKRAKVPFDTRHFDKLKKRGNSLSTQETFIQIYQSNHWGADSSVSGHGSEADQTAEISVQIPKLVEELFIKHFLDVPCGDFNWFSKMEINLDSYLGGDIIQEIIEKNNQCFKNSWRSFQQLDLIKDPLPAADMLLCRDCLVHLSFDDILKAIENIRNSDITFLLTTTFPECHENEDITTGDWRILNLELAPFNFPAPIKIINEKCTEGDGTYADKSLALWKISDL
jgi:hypothetical protein